MACFLRRAYQCTSNTEGATDEQFRQGASWNSEHDRQNGNGARAYANEANLCRADDVGWEFLVQAPDDCGLAFNAREVEDIEEKDGKIVIHVRLVR